MDPQKLIWIDTQGSVTNIAAIFKFGDVSGPTAKKWPKVNRRLKIVNYFTCMRHLSCRWYGPPKVDLNWYPRICNPYCHDIQIRRSEWAQSKKMTESKSSIKNSKLLGGLSLHLNHLIASRLANYDWPFGTLPFGLFGSNLDTRDLETYPRTYSGHFWNRSIFDDSRAVWVLFRKWVVSENQSFLDEGAIVTPPYRFRFRRRGP